MTVVVVLALVTFGCTTTREADPSPTSSLIVETTPPTSTSDSTEAAPPDADPPETECSPDAPNLASGRTASASMSQPGQEPPLAVDDDPATAWSAGDFPVQWLEIDLGAPTAVRCIRLLVGQEQSGTTTHRINGGAHDNPGAERGTLTLDTADGQWLQLEGEWTFQFLRITTEAGPSWVSWYEVVVR